MRIAIDAMGGDNAPEELIAGALEAKELLAADDEANVDQLIIQNGTSKCIIRSLS